jgi:nucleoside-diphosphate-sugar epimerase
LMNSLIRSVRTGAPITLSGNGGGLLFQPTAAIDAARQVATLLQNLEINCPVMNIVGNEQWLLRDVAQLIGDITSNKPNFHHVPGADQVVLAETSLVRALTPPPTQSLESGIRELCA